MENPQPGSFEPFDTSKSDFDFLDSSFFSKPGRYLPSCEYVESKGDGDFAIFCELNLFVKFGSRHSANLNEAAALRMVRQKLGSKVPVPEVFGWKVRGDVVYIYMELIDGVDLMTRWNEDPEFGEKEKMSVCSQLRKMFTSLRELSSYSEGQFIGSALGGPLRDRIFWERPAAGPFNTLKDFYDWMEYLPQRFLEASQRFTDPYISRLPKESAVVFTHADFHYSNIMIAKNGPPQVLAIVDWEQSGWYPEWWEYFKMSYTTGEREDWRVSGVSHVLEAKGRESILMLEYSMTIGAV